MEGGWVTLATLRDEHRQGPETAWNATFSDEAGFVVPLFSYEDASKGSHKAWWWPSAAAVAGREYTLTLSRSDGSSVSAGFQFDTSQTLNVPQVGLSHDGNRLTWEPVQGALAYACRVFSGGQLQLSTLQASAGCDVRGLPPGSYSAAVLALSALASGPGDGPGEHLLPHQLYRAVAQESVMSVAPVAHARPTLRNPANGKVLRTNVPLASFALE